MCVLHKGTSDQAVSVCPTQSVSARVAQEIRRRCLSYVRRGWRTDNPVRHSFGEMGAGLVDMLNSSDADVLNLHWISGMLSVADIGKLKKPIVWTLHDMWAFCGGEHYAPDEDAARFRRGYNTRNRPAGECGPDLNLQTWNNKRLAWAAQGFTVVCPSNWLARCASESVLFTRLPVYVIHNCLNTVKTWRPIPRDEARTVLNLPRDRKLILFGADGGIVDPRKGGDLLRKMIARVVSGRPQAYELVIYGQSNPSNFDVWPCPIAWLGPVRDDRVLAQVYSAADVMIVSSRQDNLPNAAVEAQACGTPVAAFNVGGLPDIVTHRETGWLAKPYDIDELADGVIWILKDETRYTALSAAARKRAVERFDESPVANQYADLYHQVLINYKS